MLGVGVGIRRPSASTRNFATGPPAGVNSTANGDWPPVGITSYSGGARRVPMTRPKASYSVTVTLTSTASSGPVLAMTPETV